MPSRCLVAKGGQAALTLTSVVVATGAFLYVTGDPTQFDLQFRSKYISHLSVVWAHGTASTLALAIGPWQFWPALRQRWPRLHRLVGLLYMMCMIVGGLSAIPMALDAHGGFASQLGFGLIGPLWIATAGLGFAAALRRDFADHRAWMMRNFALTFGAVLLRLYLYALQYLGFAFNDVYPYVTWSSWLPTLLITEIALRPRWPLSSQTAATARVQV